MSASLPKPERTARAVAGGLLAVAAVASVVLVATGGDSPAISAPPAPAPSPTASAPTASPTPTAAAALREAFPFPPGSAPAPAPIDNAVFRTVTSDLATVKAFYDRELPGRGITWRARSLPTGSTASAAEIWKGQFDAEGVTGSLRLAPSIDDEGVIEIEVIAL